MALIGYKGARLPETVLGHPCITAHELAPFTYKLPRQLKPLFLVYAAIKISYQLCQLFYTFLIAIPRPEYILVQNPPSIPTLLVGHAVCLLRGSKLVIDWHNFGYTILGLSLGPKHPITRVSYYYERLFGRGAHANLCVTHAMSKELKNNWGVSASVLHDHPPDNFRKLALAERHALFNRLFDDGTLGGLNSWNMEAFTKKNGLFF